MKRRWSNFFHKLTNWEYWPFEILYFPVFFYWLYLSVKARSLLYFTASNPSVFGGGIRGESKEDIYRLIPAQYLPAMFLVKEGCTSTEILNMLAESEISYPLICKPDIGERGNNVQKIGSEVELLNYHEKYRSRYFVQEYVPYPVEAGIFYYRYPGTKTGKISSVTLKQFLSVTGNGRKTINELMDEYPRARLQASRILKNNPGYYSYVPANGEMIELEPIGNHCRGTMFLDGCSNIDQQLTSVIDNISRQINGFYFGRFDIRCSCIPALKQGKEFKILELNGAGAEPTHIYHPGSSIFKAYKIIFHHWKVLYKISRLNYRSGIPYMKLSEALKYLLTDRK